MTIREAILAGTRRLQASPDLAEDAGRDAELLLLHQLSLTRADLIAHPERLLSEGEAAAYQARLARRLACEPIQYITGEQEFYGLRLRVTPAVLIPRPETEHLVEAVLELLPESGRMAILDVGTGSGAIAIALAAHLREAAFTAVDVSSAALAVAGENARAHGLEGRIRCLESDLLGSLHGERFDVIVSNPPYVPEGDRLSLHTQVRDHEPAQALFAGRSGLEVYKRLIPQAQGALGQGGLLAMEIGWGQEAALTEMLHEWTNVLFVADLQGIARVVLARRGA